LIFDCFAQRKEPVGQVGRWFGLPDFAIMRLADGSFQVAAKSRDILGRGKGTKLTGSCVAPQPILPKSVSSI